jgi:uncharacterized membrane protein
MLSLLMIYHLGKILYGSSVGLIAVFLTAVSPWHIYLCQNARMYTLLLFFSLVSTYYFVLMWEQPSCGKYFFCALFTLLALYTQNIAVFMVAGQNLYLVLRMFFPFRKGGRGDFSCEKGEPRKKSPPFAKGEFNRNAIFWKWLMTQAAVLILYLPWILITISHIGGMQGGNYWVTREPVFWYMGSLMFIFAGTIKYSAAYGLCVLLCLLAAAGIFVNPEQAEKNAPDPSMRNFYPAFCQSGFLLSLLVVPPLLTAISSQMMQPFFIPRSFIASSAAFYLLAGAGAEGLRKWGYSLPLGLLVIVALIVLGQSYFPGQVRENYRDPFLEVIKHAAPGDAVVGDIESSIFYYDYLSQRDDIETGELPEIMKNRPEFITKRCAEKPNSHIWFVRRAPCEEFMQLAKKSGYRIIETRGFAPPMKIHVMACEAVSESRTEK